MLQFVENGVPSDWHVATPTPVLSVVFHADGEVGVLREQPASGAAAGTIASASGPKLSLGGAHTFRVRIRKRKITVSVAGQEVLTCESPVDIPGTWGLTAPDDSAAMWYGVVGLDREEIRQWVRDLDDKVAADQAAISLVAKGPAVLPFVIERLAKSSYLEARKPDPVFKVLRAFGHPATSARPAILVSSEEAGRISVIDAEGVLPRLVFRTA